MVNYYMCRGGFGGSDCGSFKDNGGLGWNIKSLFGWNDKRAKENNRSGSNDAEDDENKGTDKFEKYGITQDEIYGRYVNTNGRGKK